MKKPRKTARVKSERLIHPDSALFWACLSLLALVPLAFSASVYTKYSLPKFAILLVGSSALLFFWR